MKILSCLLSVLMSVATFVAFPSVGHIYMSASGNDANNGSKDSPIASFDKAKAHIVVMCRDLRPDTVVVHIGPGTYFLNGTLELGLAQGGADWRATVIYEGAGMGKTILCGGKKLGRFIPNGDGLWKTYIPEVVRYGFGFDQMYINGERRFRARTPDAGKFIGVKSAEETVLDPSGERAPVWSALRVIPDAELGRLPVDGRVVVSMYHKWDVTRKRLLHQDRRDGSLHFSCPGMKPWNRIDNRTRLVVENYFEALDSPGEWFLREDGWLFYMPYDGENMDNITCMVPVVDKLVAVRGRDAGRDRVRNITFRNLSFEVCGYKVPAQGDDPMQAASNTDAAISVDFASNIVFEDCTVAHTGQYGIWFREGCSDSRVQRCHLYDLGAGGIKIGTKKVSADSARITRRIVVDNNIIQHGGFVFPTGVGVIIFHGSDNEVTHNDIADLRYSGISVGWIWGYAYSPSKRNRIEYNHVHHLGWGELSDMGGIYTLGASEGTSVSHNRIHHIYSLYYGGWGLYTDEGSSGIVLENNLVYRCKSAGFHQHYGKDNIVRNNIFAGQLRAQLEATRVEPHNSFTFTRNIIWSDSSEMCGINWDKVNFRTDSNCYFNSSFQDIRIQGLTFGQWQAQGRDVHSVVADPGFRDPAAGDFNLRKNSILKKIGFVPFDYAKAGVYGPEEWIRRAQLKATLLKEFDQRVQEYEQLGLTNFAQ